MAMEEEHLPVALQRAEQVVAPQQDAPNVRHWGGWLAGGVVCAGGSGGGWKVTGGCGYLQCPC